VPPGPHRELGRALDRRGPFVVVLAGPNGAGKSTFFEVYLEPLGLPFVNADHIARTLAPANPGSVAYASAAAAAAERRRLVAEGRSFVAETVFSDPAGEKLAFLREAGSAGFTVILVFIGLESPELCTARVVQRVEEGGHDVPDEKILDRYPRTLANLREAVAIADHVFLFDNSSCDEPYCFVATYRNGRLRRRGGPAPLWAEALPGLGRGTRRPRQGPDQRARRARGRSTPPMRGQKGRPG
jgi:predicted ABC-type ATPase